MCPENGPGGAAHPRASESAGPDRFFRAAEDLRFLLGRGYPRPGALTFVGNRYQLPKADRDVLARGVYPPDEASQRRARLAPAEALARRAVGLDGHNILITLECALSGRTLVDCDDGAVRDTAGASASYRPSDLTFQALDLTLAFLQKQGAAAQVFYLDAPMSQSGELASLINATLAGRSLMGRAHAVPVPEVELRAFTGLVATSDSVLIDQVDQPVDLAGLIIRETMPEVELVALSAPGRQ